MLLSGFHKECLESLKIEGNSELQVLIANVFYFYFFLQTFPLFT